jgi:hypothetical protein
MLAIVRLSMSPLLDAPILEPVPTADLFRCIPKGMPAWLLATVPPGRFKER